MKKSGAISTGQRGRGMARYDIVFVGQMGVGTVVPFRGSSFIEPGSPVLFASVAASRLGKKIAAVTTVSKSDEHLLEPMRNVGIDLFVQPGETVRYRVVFPTADVDERQSNLIESGSPIYEIPPFEPCLVHLCCIGNRHAQIYLMRSLKARGFRLSVDMQGLLLQANIVTGKIEHCDLPEKKEILKLVDFLKVDAVEAKTLTGSENVYDQAEILANWGVREIILTNAEGVLARHMGRTTFTKFTSARIRGRMGRGDTVIGSYLARRLDHSVEESLRFATALASVKMEAPGPFTGSLEDVIRRIDHGTS